MTEKKKKKKKKFKSITRVQKFEITGQNQRCVPNFRNVLLLWIIYPQLINKI